MNLWRIFYYVDNGMNNLFIVADSFDTALEMARKIGLHYSGGQIATREDLDKYGIKIE